MLQNFSYSMNKDRLKAALKEANSREAALQMLVQTPLSAAALLPLLSEVMDAAIDSSNLTAIELARHVLSKYQAEPEVRANIQLIATSYLAAQNEWHYRRIAELYALLKYEDELATFLRLCKPSLNADIREINDDFYRP